MSFWKQEAADMTRTRATRIVASVAWALVSVGGWLTASTALAEEVLYCVDTDVVGFKWDKAGKARATSFSEGRYTVKVLSGTARILTQMVGDIAGILTPMTCQTPYEGTIACVDALGTNPWIFYHNTYTRAFLAGPPAGENADPNIWIRTRFM
jgi:hypothetical protein